MSTTLVAVIIITTAKEDVRRAPRPHREEVGSKKHRTFSQEAFRVKASVQGELFKLNNVVVLHHVCCIAVVTYVT